MLRTELLVGAIVKSVLTFTDEKEAGQERRETQKVLSPVQIPNITECLSTLHANVLGGHLAHSVGPGGCEGNTTLRLF